MAGEHTWANASTARAEALVVCVFMAFLPLRLSVSVSQNTLGVNHTEPKHMDNIRRVNDVHVALSGALLRISNVDLIEMY